MDTLLYCTARAAVTGLQALPLGLVARIGRCGGALAYGLDARHRRVALANLRSCLGAELAERQIRALAREHFRRLGENYASSVKTAAMSDEALGGRLDVSGVDKVRRKIAEGAATSLMFAIGHFGNFELYARAGRDLEGYTSATTYRALRQPRLNRLMQELRGRSGCLFFERRTDAAALRAALNSRRLLLGLLVDQHAGRRGLRVPFFGRDCSTNPAAAILALRYRLPLFPAYCFRIGIGRWRLEVGDEIPTHDTGAPRSPEAIMRDVNQAFEAAVRRDPANWFWVHQRWKSPGRPPRTARGEHEPLAQDDAPHG